MRKRLPVLPFLLLLCSLQLHAQSVGAENIRIGTSSDSVLALLRGTYTTIDSVRDSDTRWPHTILLAPVPLAGLDGLLVLAVDSSGSVSEYRWGRAPDSTLPHHGVWENFTVWKSWQTPSRKETATVTAKLMDHYFPTDGIELSGPPERKSQGKSRKNPQPDDETPHTLNMQWQNKGTWISVAHNGETLLVSVNRKGFDVEDR